MSNFETVSKSLEELLANEVFGDDFKETRKVHENLVLSHEMLEKAQKKCCAKKPILDKIKDDIKVALRVLKGISGTRDSELGIKNKKVGSVEKKIEKILVSLDGDQDLKVKEKKPKKEMKIEIDESEDESSDDECENGKCNLDDKTYIKFYEKIIKLISGITKAKLFDEEMDAVVKKCGDKKMDVVLDSIKKNLIKTIAQFKKLNDEKVFEILDDVLVDLEHCYKKVDDEHEDQMFLIKECLHDILELDDLDICERVEKNIKITLKGIKVN